jgi:hypothetical protein
VFRTRPRGSLRAAALLAVGVSPLLAGVSAAAPAPSLDGLEDVIGDAAELNATVADQAGKIASGKTVKLPTPAALPETAGALRKPAPQLPPVARALPPESAVPALAESQGRALPVVPQLPVVDQLQLNQLPLNQLPLNQLPVNQLPLNQLPVNQLPVNQLPSTGKLPVQLPQVGDLPVALPGLG